MASLSSEMPRAATGPSSLRRALPFFFVYLIPASALAGGLAGGWWTWAGVAFVFMVTPALDSVLGLDIDNSNADPDQRDGHLMHRVALYLWLPTQIALMLWALITVTSGQTTPLETVGLLMSVGLVAGGGGITIAHELMHRPGRVPKATAEVLMTLVTYAHFCVEHVLGHHRHVATPGDPASSRLGQSLYRFWFQTVFGSLRSAWRQESQRVARSKKVRAWSLKDRRLRYLLTTATMYGLIFAFTGGWGVLAWAAMGVVAFSLLEVVNYVEHYGLSRRETSPGRYERVTPKHSWNSAHRLTRWYLFSLPRHADHHHLASRPYWMLRHIEDSPQLPAGYATMVLLALVPPLWRSVMDHRVADWNARQAEGVEAG